MSRGVEARCTVFGCRGTLQNRAPQLDSCIKSGDVNVLHFSHGHVGS